MTTWHIGDRAYLVPTLSTAPSLAYKQPQCIITGLTGDRAEIELPEGHRLWTSLRNISIRPLQSPRPTLPAVPKRCLTLAGNEQEPVLW